MNLTLIGHDDRYAVEQLQMSLFPEGTGGEAVVQCSNMVYKLCNDMVYSFMVE